MAATYTETFVERLSCVKTLLFWEKKNLHFVKAFYSDYDMKPKWGKMIKRPDWMVVDLFCACTEYAIWRYNRGHPSRNAINKICRPQHQFFSQ